MEKQNNTVICILSDKTQLKRNRYVILKVRTNILKRGIYRISNVRGLIKETIANPKEVDKAPGPFWTKDCSSTKTTLTVFADHSPRPLSNIIICNLCATDFLCERTFQPEHIISLSNPSDRLPIRF